MLSMDKGIAYLFRVMMAIFTVAAAGCSTPNTSSTGGFDPDSGGHPAGWVSSHSGFVSSDAVECTPCHDSSLDGGISMVSCLTSDCHHGTVPGWSSPLEHGTSAKRNSSSLGFISCQICHGVDFSGGITGMDCFSCHTAAPHPLNWRRGDIYVHTNTAEGNAPACADCHLDGNNSPIGAPPPPLEGTPPGCFNNTLCHGVAISHPSGWSDADAHGPPAKGTPGGSSGFAYCQTCHGQGADFAGGAVQVSCYPCHGVDAPHPSQWAFTSVRSHTTVDEGNAPECAFCHTGGSNSPLPQPPAPPPETQPGCFNNTLCHGAGGTHPGGWSSPSQHGATAKSSPGVSSGFDYCTVCHGSNFAGDIALSCLNNTSCHGTGVQSPHSPGWIPLKGDNFDHTTTDQGNAPVCGLCHYNEFNFGSHLPAQPSAGDSGCFNNTLCHGNVSGGTHAENWLNSNVPASFHGTFVAEMTCETSGCHPVSGHPTCTACHFDNQGSRVTGSFDHTGNVISSHRSVSGQASTVCENCHETSRTFRGGTPSCSGGGGSHPGNEGCHYDSATLDPVLTNPRY